MDINQCKDVLISHLDSLEETIEYKDQIVKEITLFIGKSEYNNLSDFIIDYLHSDNISYFTICSKESFNEFETGEDGLSFIYTPLNDHSRGEMKKGDIVFCYRQGQFSSLDDALDQRGIYGIGMVLTEPQELYKNKEGHNRWGVAIVLPFILKRHLELRNIQLNPKTINLTPYNGNRNDALQYIESKEHYSTLLSMIATKNPDLRTIIEKFSGLTTDDILPDDFWKENTNHSRPSNSASLQQIYYGAPGTGKSHRIKEQLEALNVPKENIFRTTFHPDSDFSSFVGAYKPTMKPVADKYKAVVGKDEEISYSFVPQIFIKSYVRAYQTKENVYLIIEEINRGNCAQIFGDLFQLLDRDENGTSEYTIKADADIRAYLEDVLGKDADGIKGGELCLPSNLYIYATMNTSDQSLFPIDSAFKRRWDWEYEPIKYKNTDWIIEIGGSQYSWTSFQKEVNNKIFETTNSEDKMLGDYFVNPRDGIISKELLLNKILFYLWNDVCKDGDGDIFKTDENKDVKFSDLYGDNGTNLLLSMMRHLKVSLVSEKVENTKDDEEEEEDEEDEVDEGNNGTPTRYSINGEETDGNGKPWKKGRLVKRAVEIYCDNHKQESADQIRTAWINEGFLIPHIVETKADKEKRLSGSKDKTGRERAKEIKLSNGESIYVSTEVGDGKIYRNFEDFISKIKDKTEWGIDIQIL